jgi:hypothetical protein
MPKNSAHRIVQCLHSLAAKKRAQDESDQFLLSQFVLQRDEAAFAVLLERHGPMVMGVCLRVLRDEHLAEDAFQATFLVLGSCLAGFMASPSVCPKSSRRKLIEPSAWPSCHAIYFAEMHRWKR